MGWHLFKPYGFFFSFHGSCFMFLVDLRSIYVFKGIELTIANTNYVENERDWVKPEEDEVSNFKGSG